MNRSACFLATIVLLWGCTAGSRVPAPRPSEPPVARPAPPPRSGVAPRPDPAAPAVQGRSFPECDPRSGDADRVQVGMGLLAGDCADEAGRNGTYVTRFASVRSLPSPAQRAGLQVGDRIVRVDSCEVRSTHDVAMQLRSALPGWVARVYVERNGKMLDIFVPTVALPRRSEASSPSLSTAGCKAIGRKPAS